MLRYICLSDMHAGAMTSLLTDLQSADPAEAEDDGPFERTSDVTRSFACALEAFLAAAAQDVPEPPQLILLGDTLDLQFSRRDRAAKSARGFLEALWKTGRLSPRVMATAGNHDHSLWTEARYSLAAGSPYLGAEGDSILDATSAFSPAPDARSRFLEALLADAGFTDLDFRYPNLGFHSGDRVVLLHHGHFVEDEYRLMSTVMDALAAEPRPPLTAAHLSAENAGWIDFAWSSLGDAVRVGTNAHYIYQMMLTSTGFRTIADAWAAKLGHVLSDRLPMSGSLSMQSALTAMSHVGLDVTLGSFRDTERYSEVEALSHSGFEGLEWYLNGPTLGQIDDELRRRKPFRPDLAFVFGHTHKPFTDRIRTKGFDLPVRVHNSGGWTLNGPRLGTREGVAMILIDDDCHVASLRLFGTPENGRMAPVRLEMLSDGSPGCEEFRQEILRWLEASRPAWDALTDAAHAAYDLRQALLLRLTAGEYGVQTPVRAAE